MAEKKEEKKEEPTVSLEAEPTTEEKPTEPMTTIPTKQLQGIIDRMETFEKEHNLLMATADKARVARYQAQHKEEVNRKCKLRTWAVEVGEGKDKRNEDKVIIGWEMTMDRGREYNEARERWEEHQDIRLFLEDDTRVDVPYAVFGKRYVLIDGEIKSETKKTVEGKETIEYTIQANDKEYTIPGYAIN